MWDGVPEADGGREKGVEVGVSAGGRDLQGVFLASAWSQCRSEGSIHIYKAGHDFVHHTCLGYVAAFLKSGELQLGDMRGGSISI